VCSEDYESGLILLGEEGSYIPDKNADVEAKLMVYCNCTIFISESIVTAVIISADWWDCMPKKLPPSIIAHVDRGVTRYERE